MRNVKPKGGQGRVQWNAGGWFGALSGSTAFMLVGALLFGSQSMTLAIVWLACYAIAVVCAILIWTRRESFASYPETQSLLFVVGTAATIAILFAFLMRLELSEGVNATPTKVLLVLLIVPGLMLGSHLLERRAA